MRLSAVFLTASATLCTTAFAAPLLAGGRPWLGIPPVSAVPIFNESQFWADQMPRIGSVADKRDVELLLRAAADESGAFGWTDIFKLGANVISHFMGDSGDQQQSREFVELLTRAATDDSQSGSLAFKPFDLWHLGPGLLMGDGSQVLSGTSSQSDTQQQRRELAELLARTTSSDPQSGAFDITSIMNHIFRRSDNQQQRREFAEILARAAAGADQSGAFDLTGAINGAVNFFTSLFRRSENQQQRREFAELLARAAAGTDQSGAFNIIDAFNGIGSVIGSIFGRSEHQQREFAEILARAASDADQSGAFDIGHFFQGAFNALTQILKRNDVSRREVVEILARAAAESDESGAFSWSWLPKIIGQIL